MDNVIIGKKCSKLLEPQNEFEKQARKESLDLYGFDITFIMKAIATQKIGLGEAVLLGVLCDLQTEKGCRISDEELAKECDRRITIYNQHLKKVENLYGNDVK